MRVELPDGGYIVLRELVGLDRLKREMLYNTIGLNADSTRFEGYQALYITGIIIQTEESSLNIPDVSANKDTIFEWWNELAGTPENAEMFSTIKSALDSLNYPVTDPDLAPPEKN